MRKIQIRPPATSFQLDSRFRGHPFSFRLHPVTSEVVLFEFNAGELALLSLTSGNILSECARRDFLTGTIGHDFSSNLSTGLLVRAVNFGKTPILELSDLSVKFEIEAQHGDLAISTKFSPCGRYLAIGYGRYPLSAPNRPIDSVIEIWGMRGEPELIAWQRMPGVACGAIAWSGDSSFLAVFSGHINQQTGYLALIESTGWNITQICETRLGGLRQAFVGPYSVILFGSAGCELRSWLDLGYIDDVSIFETRNSPGFSLFGPGGFIFSDGGLISFEDEEMVILPDGIIHATSLDNGGIAALTDSNVLLRWHDRTLDFR